MKTPHTSAPTTPLDERPLQIGVSIPRADATDKAAGRVLFAADYYSPQMLWAGVKRADVAHARILRIDVTEAERVPGVVKALTSRDIKGSNRQGVVRRDQPVLADDKVRHFGDAVALVLAETTEALQKALDVIRVEYEPLPAVINMEPALLPDSAVIHENHHDGNLLLGGRLTVGKGAQAEGDCEILLNGSFETPRQEHAYLETETGFAYMERDILTIVCSTQTPFRDRAETAEALGISPQKIRIIAPYLGGGFGGKDGISVQTLLGAAAVHAAGRPVKMWLSREESFVSSPKRHAMRIDVRLGATDQGRLHYLNACVHADTGPYDHLGGVVLALAMEHSGGPYRIENCEISGKAVYTNNPIGGAFRGFGAPQVTFAIEQMMDMLAARLKIDPIELRLKNCVGRGDRNAVGKTLTTSTGIGECLRALRDHPDVREREKWKRAAGRFTKRGVGFAAVMQASGYGPVVPDVANAKLELTDEGRFRVYCGVADMGQGTTTTALQIAGAVLNQKAGAVEAVLPDTERTLPCGSASASRCTYTFGNAVIGAAEMLRDRLRQRAADMFFAERESCALIPGLVRHLPTGREIKLATLAGMMQRDERVVVHHFRAPTAPDNVGAQDSLRLHGMPHAVFSYGAHCACIEVDELTGRTRVDKYIAAHDCGTVLNPQILSQQIEGAIIQGIGFALHEELLCEDGRIMTPNLSTYIVPLMTDIPEIECIPVQAYEPSGPFGLKGAGEVGINGPLAAIGNALADACGVRLFNAPFTPERVHAAMKSTEGEPE